MKQLALTILMTLVSSLALAAGGTGGGGWKPGPMAMTTRQSLDLSSFGGASSGTGGGGGGDRPTEIVFNMGQKDGLVKFAYGQLVDKKWQIEKFELIESELTNDPSMIKALQDSKSLNSWAEIK